MYPVKNEEIYDCSISKIFVSYVTLATFKKLQYICGSHPDCSVGQ